MGFALAFELHAIFLDAAKSRVDSIGADISRQVRGAGVQSAIGEALSPEQELTLPGSLDHWASPSTYVEVDNAAGYQEGKSTNMGGAHFGNGPVPRTGPVEYFTERKALGDAYVRDELVAYPRGTLVVKVGENLRGYDEALARMRLLMGVTLLLAAIAVVAGSYAVASGAIGPINRLISAMRQIRSDQLQRRLGWTSRTDEIGTLATTFDAMLDRLEEGFERERQFISDASHELKTPLTIINANAQMLERWADDDPAIRSESLRAIRQESGSLAQMVNGMLLLAKAESGDGIPRERVALDGVLGEAVRLAQPRAAEKALAITFASQVPAGSPVVLGDPNLLRQLFTNLIDNALKFTESGRIDVTLSESAGRAVVEVADTGVGIDDEALERVFDRFFRTDKSRSRAVPGTGLGLAIVRSIVHAHDGTVAARQNAGGGTTFRIELPAFMGLS